MARPRTVLLKTSAASDVKRSGGQVDITGLETFYNRNVLKINQFKYRAEVVKVETIGSSSYTPLASTKYIVEIFDNGSRTHGINNATVPVQYIYKTPADLTTIGATAALQREAIHAALIVKINADSPNNVVAVTLGTGTGFTITDDANYYAPKLAGGQGPRTGKTTIKLALDENGRGFVDSTDRTLTTDAVYQFGDGTRMSQDIPVVWALGGGNIVAGEFDTPMTTDNPPVGPVSGQQYDAFAISCLVYNNLPTINPDYQGFRVATQVVFVDNGLGTATTNAAGFLTFEKAMLRLIFLQYSNDGFFAAEFFDNRPMFSGTGTAGIPTGTDADINTMMTRTGTFPYYIKGTSTQIFPLWDATNGSGLILDLDNTATEGLEISTQSLGTAGAEIVIGKQEASLYYKGTIADVSQANPFYVGFRKKQAFNTAISGYTDYAALGFNAAAATQTIKVMTVVGSASEVSTSSAKTWADAAIHLFEMRVLIDGTVKFYVDGVDVSGVQTIAYAFTAGLTIVPFVRAIGTGSGAPTNVVNTFAFVPDAYWKIYK